MHVKIKKLQPSAKTPTYAHEGDACFDLYAATVEDADPTGATVAPGRPVVCGTGLSFDVPAGNVMLVFSRSGHGFNQGIRLVNCVGVIDSGYLGEVKVKLTQDFDERLTGSPPHQFRPGDRIAQALILPVEAVTFEVVECLRESQRNANGFGSTGV